LIDLRALPLSSSVRREPRAVCRPRGPLGNGPHLQAAGNGRGPFP
jgi:hypothetical protein